MSRRIVDNAILDFVENSAVTANNTISGDSEAVIESGGAGEMPLTAFDA